MTDGRVYIDFLAEAGVLALGYNHPALVAAVQRTSDSVQATADIDSRGNDRMGYSRNRSCAGQRLAARVGLGGLDPGLTCGFCSVDRRSTPVK
jgi:hypothetical protein